VKTCAKAKKASEDGMRVEEGRWHRWEKSLRGEGQSNWGGLERRKSRRKTLKCILQGWESFHGQKKKKTQIRRKKGTKAHKNGGRSLAITPIKKGTKHIRCKIGETKKCFENQVEGDEETTGTA